MYTCATYGRRAAHIILYRIGCVHAGGIRLSGRVAVQARSVRMPVCVRACVCVYAHKYVQNDRVIFHKCYVCVCTCVCVCAYQTRNIGVLCARPATTSPCNIGMHMRPPSRFIDECARTRARLARFWHAPVFRTYAYYRCTVAHTIRVVRRVCSAEPIS